MKALIQIALSIVLTLLLVSCNNETNKGHDIYWDNDNLCVVMEHPTYGIVEINRPNWGKVNLNEVVEDIYDYIRKNESYETVKVWVRFESPLTDKYGNETMTYDDYEIATIPVSEAIKYQSAEYLDRAYNITDNFNRIAFGDIFDNIDNNFVNTNKYIGNTGVEAANDSIGVSNPSGKNVEKPKNIDYEPFEI